MFQKGTLLNHSLFRLLLIPALFTALTSATFAQTVELDVESKALPVGAGLPDNKPIDVFGFHTGMDGKAALEKFEATSHDPNYRPTVGMFKLQFAKQNYFGLGDMKTRDADSHGRLITVLSSNASGNQVLGIHRKIAFKRGSEPGTAAYLDAIKAKYGEPSLSVSELDSQLELYFAYRDGEPVTAATRHELCNIYLQTAAGTVREGRNKGGYIFQELGRDSAENQKSPNRCSAIMEITLRYGITDNGLRNKNSIRMIDVTFFDADRTAFAIPRDAEAQQDLINRANNAPLDSGTGKTKL